MRNRFLTAAGFAVAIAVVSLMPVRVDGQAVPKAAAPAAKRAVPRTPDEHPDLQGTYDLATLTPVERPAGTPLVMTDEQAAKLEKAVAARKSSQDAPIKADRDATRAPSAATARPARPATSAATTASGSIRDRATR